MSPEYLVREHFSRMKTKIDYDEILQDGITIINVKVFGPLNSTSERLLKFAFKNRKDIKLVLSQHNLGNSTDINYKDSIGQMISEKIISKDDLSSICRLNDSEFNEFVRYLNSTRIHSSNINNE